MIKVDEQMLEKVFGSMKDPNLIVEESHNHDAGPRGDHDHTAGHDHDNNVKVEE